MNRRKFVKDSAIAATAAGTLLLTAGSGLKSLASTIPVSGLKPASDTKDVFKKCGACSHTFFYLLNRDFGHLRENEERASDPLAGGLMMGHQCGMLWGSSLATGAESFRRNGCSARAIESTITTTRMLMTSFTVQTGSVNCEDVIGFNVGKKSGIARMMVKILLQGGMKNSTCFKLADRWAPEAIMTASAGLAATPDTSLQMPLSCASEVVRKSGGSEEEITMVSGFAGGLGLQGHACGALAAALWKQTLTWCKDHPGENPSQFSRMKMTALMKSFEKVTGSEMLCKKITGQSFESPGHHSEYLRNGGCRELIEQLAAT